MGGSFQFMDENKKALLQNFADDLRTFEAVKEILLEQEFSYNLSLDNENLGAEVRAGEKAKQLVETGFKKIKQMRTNEKVGKEKNPAR